MEQSIATAYVWTGDNRWRTLETEILADQESRLFESKMALENNYFQAWKQMVVSKDDSVNKDFESSLKVLL